MNSPNQHISSRELLVFFFKFRKRLFFAFILPFIAFIFISFVPVPKYTSTSTLIIRLGSEYVYQPELGTSQLSSSTPLPFNSEEIFKSEVAILDSDELHGQVIDEVGLNNIFPELTKPSLLSPWTKPLKDRIHSFLVSQGLAKDETPEAHERYLRASAIQIFDKNFEIALEKESAVIDLSFHNRDPDIATQTLQSLLNLYLEKRQKLYLDPRAHIATREAETTHQKAIDAERAVDDFKVKHKIYSFDDERTSLIQQRDEIQKQMLTMAGMYRPTLQERLDYFNKRLNELSAIEHDFNSLQNDAKVAEDEYAQFQHRLEEAKAYDDLEEKRASSVRIIQQPIASAEPKRLQSLIVAIGFVVSLLSLLITAAITQHMNSGFMTPEQLERAIGLKVIGVIPFQE